MWFILIYIISDSLTCTRMAGIQTLVFFDCEATGLSGRYNVDWLIRELINHLCIDREMYCMIYFCTVKISFSDPFHFGQPDLDPLQWNRKLIFSDFRSDLEQDPDPGPYQNETDPKHWL